MSKKSGEGGVPPLTTAKTIISCYVRQWRAVAGNKFTIDEDFSDDSGSPRPKNLKKTRPINIDGKIIAREIEDDTLRYM